MTAEEAQDIYWAALREFDWHDTSANRPYQAQNKLQAWDAVIKAIRKDSAEECERLRARVRDLEAIVLARVEKDAACNV